jgi:GTPase SAR1 family protein
MYEKPKKTQQRYVAMIGDVSVGKTTLAERYIKEENPLDQNIKVSLTRIQLE